MPQADLSQFSAVWPHALYALRDTLSNQQYQMWIAPLTVSTENDAWVVYAKNNFVFGFVKSHFWQKIEAAVANLAPNAPVLQLKIGLGEQVSVASAPAASASSTWVESEDEADVLLTDDVLDTPSAPVAAETEAHNNMARGITTAQDIIQRNLERPRKPKIVENSSQIITPSAPAIIKSTATELPPIDHPAEQTRLNPSYTFETLVQGKGNRMAYAGAQTIAENPGSSMYNPYFIYGSTGLGKTHLIQAIGNRIYQQHPRAKIRYIHAETYVRDIMKAFRSSSFDEFKRHYHSLDLLLIDDVQFISGKDRTMEEFFYLFNHLLDEKKQVVMTCDTLPANIKNMDDRLKSRFSWGLTVELEPPELEMRVAILQKKAEAAHVQLQEKAAFFIAQHIRSNVRELEGAFKRVAAHSLFQHKPIDIELATEA